MINQADQLRQNHPIFWTPAVWERQSQLTLVTYGSNLQPHLSQWPHLWRLQLQLQLLLLLLLRYQHQPLLQGLLKFLQLTLWLLCFDYFNYLCSFLTCGWLFVFGILNISNKRTYEPRSTLNKCMGVKVANYYYVLLLSLVALMALAPIANIIQTTHTHLYIINWVEVHFLIVKMHTLHEWHLILQQTKPKQTKTNHTTPHNTTPKA